MITDRAFRIEARSRCRACRFELQSKLGNCKQLLFSTNSRGKLVVIESFIKLSFRKIGKTKAIFFELVPQNDDKHVAEWSEDYKEAEDNYHGGCC